MTSPGSESSLWVQPAEIFTPSMSAFRDNPEYDVVAFTAAQIEGIEDRCHVATPVDLARLIAFPKPHYRVRYDLEEISHPDLAEIMSSFLHNHR
jgi:predicted GTPase